MTNLSVRPTELLPFGTDFLLEFPCQRGENISAWTAFASDRVIDTSQS